MEGRLPPMTFKRLVQSALHATEAAYSGNVHGRPCGSCANQDPGRVGLGAGGGVGGRAGADVAYEAAEIARRNAETFFQQKEYAEARLAYEELLAAV